MSAVRIHYVRWWGNSYQGKYEKFVDELNTLDQRPHRIDENSWLAATWREAQSLEQQLKSAAGRDAKSVTVSEVTPATLKSGHIFLKSDVTDFKRSLKDIKFLAWQRKQNAK